MPAPLRSRIPYYPALDGLRGAALLVMLVFHQQATWIEGGYLSLSTFFTLSGFLITTLLLVEQEANGRIALARFWERRLRRLMPAALLGIVLAAVFVELAGTRSQTARLRWDGLSALFYFANFRFMGLGDSYWEIFRRPSPLQHYWSLSIEEQFYFVYPLLLLGLSAVAGRGRGTARALLLGLALLSTALMAALSLSGATPARLYYSTDTRAAEFLAGAVLATFVIKGTEIRPWRGRGHGLATLAAVAFVAAALVLVEEDSAFLYRGGFALYAIATAVIINAALQPSVVGAVLAWWPLSRMGEISYGVYVYHWPIYLWLDPLRTGIDGAALLALRLAVTVTLATLSYVLLERPVRQGRWPRGMRARLAVPAAAAAVAALLLGVSAELPAQRISRTAAARLESMPSLDPPFAKGPLRVLVLGDSVAGNIGAGFKHWARTHPGSATVWNFTYFGCSVARDVRQTRFESERRRCRTWRHRWRNSVNRFRPDLVVIHAGVWDLRDAEIPRGGPRLAPGDADFDSWLLDEFELAVDVASSRGARVVWLTTPCVGPVPERSPLRNTGAAEADRIEHLNRSLLPALAASRPRLVLLDLFARACPDGRFSEYDEHRRPIRSDFLHLTSAWAAGVAGWILDDLPPDLRPGDTVAVAAPSGAPRQGSEEP